MRDFPTAQRILQIAQIDKIARNITTNECGVEIFSVASVCVFLYPGRAFTSESLDL